MRYLLTFILLSILSSTAFAADYRGACTIVFQASSTLHDFQGKASCRPFTAGIIDGVVEMSQLSVAVADMDTDNAKRDKEMREMFDHKKYPLITGSAGSVALKDIGASAKKGAKSATKVGFNLKIREVVKPVTATVTDFTETDARITAKLAFTLSLADYQLKPPSVLGVIRVDDKVSVTATIVLDAE